MDDTKKNGWSQLGHTAKALGTTLLGLETRATVPPEDCVARQHAGCTDFSHCRSCSTLEEVFRTAAWMERKWPHVQSRNRS